MSVRESARPQSPHSGRRVQVTSPVTSGAGAVRHEQTTTCLSAPLDDGAFSRSMPTSFSFPGEGGATFGRSVSRDDSGLSIVSLGRGRPSDSGYGTDSPASLSTGALRFRFGSIDGSEDISFSPSGVEVQVEPEELDFDLELNEDDDYDDDDVFLDVVPEEEVDGDDEDAEPAFSRRPVALRRDVVDGMWRRHGGSDGQTDTSTEEDEESPGASSGGSGSSSNPIAIPRPLRTEALEYAVALAYTPPNHMLRGIPATGSGAILLARGSLRHEGALWSMTQAQLNRGPNSLAVRRAALFATSPHRNGLQRVLLEEPHRRHSDGVIRNQEAGSQASHTGNHSGGAVGLTPPAPPVQGRRCRSESAAPLERQLGQELRRISDEFQLSYSTGRSIPGRLDREASSGHLSTSLPERRRRGSLVDQFFDLFRPGPSGEEEAVDDQPITYRPRSRSAVDMASGMTPNMFRRSDSLGRRGSSPDASLHQRLSQCDDYDEVDNAYHGDDDKEDSDVMFHLSTEQ